MIDCIQVLFCIFVWWLIFGDQLSIFDQRLQESTGASGAGRFCSMKTGPPVILQGLWWESAVEPEDRDAAQAIFLKED